jgi:hypothetical protein
MQNAIQPVRIEPGSIYNEGALLFNLGLPNASVARARRDGLLRFACVGKKNLYLGSWVLSWLENISVMASARDGDQ